jgi:cobalt-zinc-cadmium resistance protein CzcA
MGGEFIPTLDEGDFAVETRLITGSSLSESVEVNLKTADVLIKNFPEVNAVIGKIGTSEIPTDPMSIEVTDLIITLKEKDEWVTATNREELADKMLAKLEAELPGVMYGFQQPIQLRTNELMTGRKTRCSN